jgi:hypothetical protein
VSVSKVKCANGYDATTSSALARLSLALPLTLCSSALALKALTSAPPLRRKPLPRVAATVTAVVHVIGGLFRRRRGLMLISTSFFASAAGASAAAAATAAKLVVWCSPLLRLLLLLPLLLVSAPAYALVVALLRRISDGL